MKIRNAFTLIEVLIFVSILSFVFVALAAYSTAYLRQVQKNEHKILATHYAEELLEWLHNQKDQDWNTFLTNYAGQTQCFNSSPIVGGATPCLTPLANLFNRTVGVTNAGNVQANVYIQVSWAEVGGGVTVPLNSVFSIWEQ